MTAFMDKFKVRRDQVTERLVRQRDRWISQLPAGIQGKLQDSRPLRWGVTSGVVAAAIVGVACVLLLPSAISGIAPVRSFLGAIRRALFITLVIGLNYGLMGYLVGRRARVEPTGHVVRRVVVASLIGLVIPVIGGLLPFIAIYWGNFGARIRRGRSLSSAAELQRHLVTTEQQVLDERGQVAQAPKLQIGGVHLPNYLENLGFFFFGSPGSGKSQSIKRLLQVLKQRSDFRAIVLDRNGELMASFYDAERDLIFNPYDARSVGWSHVNEGLRPETVAAPLVPLQSTTDPFWDKAGRNLLSDIYSRTQANSEVWQVLTTYSFEDLRTFLQGTQSSDYFASEKTGAAVKATAISQLRFYEDLPEGDFSFSQWDKSNDARWLWLPLFREDAERLQPLHTMAFELIIRGLLTEENRDVQTAVVIDELAALHKLDSLTALLSEGRKFKATAVLGTQSTAQIDNTYGENDCEIVLQGAATKLILNCRSPQTAEVAADIIGKQERVDVTESRTHEGFLGGSKTYTENIRETHIVMPSEIQALPELVGYLDIADGSPPARVEVQYRDYPTINERLITG